jgi:glycosyltransferase involved in cell wall biosynthesis
MTGASILCFSSIDWDFIWQGHQEIMSRLAAQGNRVLFVENTGVRTPRLRDLPRLRQRLLNWRHSTGGFRREREGLFIYSPLVLPFPYSRVARWINHRIILRAIRRWMDTVEFHEPLVWTFLPTPLIRGLIRALEPQLTIYHCADDFAASSAAARAVRRSETALLREADLVFVTSQALFERAASLNPRVSLFPGGVDFERFSRARDSADGQPADVGVRRRFVAGYVGGIHRWVNQELLAAVADQLPDVEFLLIGPCQVDVSRLARAPNIRVLGARGVEEIPSCVRAFDVGLIPYRITDYTAKVYPTKLNEYLAMGLPVVATDLPEVRRFNHAHGDLVEIASDPAAFARAIRGALEPPAPETVRRRIELARQNDWAVRVSRMTELVEERLAARRAARARWEDALRRLYRSARRRFLRGVGLAAALFILVFHTPFVWWLAEPLRMQAAPQPSDAIVVLAGGVGESGKAGGGYQERVKRGVDLFRAGWAPRLVFVSGYTFVFQEAEVMGQLAEAHGVPRQAILLETAARNTREDVTAVRALARRHGWGRILLVSSPYHMRRAISTWRKHARDVEARPIPVRQSQFYTHPRGAGPNLEQLRGILHEYAALVYYWAKGWL